MSIWSDMSTIVGSTLAGDINFNVVKAYRSDGAWFVFGPLTLIGAIVFYYREKLAVRVEARFGRALTLCVFRAGAVVDNDPAALFHDHGVVRMCL